MRIGLAPAPHLGFTAYKVFHRKEGRSYACLKSPLTRKTISWAKYVFETTTGTLVPSGITVDHKDEDRTNDAFDNLQLLTLPENIRKNAHLTRAAKTTPKVCPCCAARFEVAERIARFWGNRRTFHCSRACAQTMQRRRPAA